MEIHITVQDADFKEGETLTDVLTRKFGISDDVAVAVSGNTATKILALEDESHAAFVPKEIAKTQAPYLPGGDNASQEEEEEEEGTPPPAASSNKEPLLNVELDSNGVPWDQGIHSSGKTFMKSGPRSGWWVKRKGVPEDVYLAKTAELKEQHAEVAGASPAEQEEAPASNTASSFLPGGDNAPATETATTPPDSKFDLGGMTMPIFLQKVGQAEKDGKIDKTIVAAVLADFEVPSLPMLAGAAHKDKMGGVAAALGLL